MMIMISKAKLLFIIVVVSAAVAGGCPPDLHAMWFDENGHSRQFVRLLLLICALCRNIQSERERERFPPRDPERLRDSRFAERLRDLPLRERDRDRERDLDRERERPLRERLRVLDLDFLRVPPLVMS